MKILSPLYLTLSDSGSSEYSYRRDLLGKVDLFRESKLSLLQRAADINVCLELITQIDLLANQANKAVADLQQYLGTSLNGFVQDALGIDTESLATAKVSMS